jgi:hydrogenase maturation protease
MKFVYTCSFTVITQKKLWPSCNPDHHSHVYHYRTIYRFDALRQQLPASYSFSSTHAFGVAEAIQLARALDQLPASLIVYGIEGKKFVAGTELSPEVERAVQEVVELVEREMQGS